MWPLVWSQTAPEKSDVCDNLQIHHLCPCNNEGGYGHTKEGVPREEVHHWSNVQVAHLRPDAKDAQRVQLGRRPKQTDRPNNDATGLAPKFYATTNERLITQRRTKNDQYRAAPAEAGFVLNNQPSLSSLDLPLTGPPPLQPFANQQQFSTVGADEDRQASSYNGAGPAPPASNGVPPGVKPGSQSLPASARAAGHLPNDHDYVQRPGPLTDHNYFMSVPLPDQDPRVNPPPGLYQQQNGRPKRNTKLPAKFQDFEMSME